MREENSNYLGFGLFFFLIVVLVLLGSVLIFLNFKNKRSDRVIKDTNEIVLSDKMKKDKGKDFIYFTEEETISEDLNLVYKVPVINLNNDMATQINNEIKNYASTIKGSLQKGDTSLCINSSTDIYNLRFLEYAIYTYQEHTTLLIRESSYTCENGFSSANKVKSYTFNVLTGERLDFNSLLKKYNTTLTNILEKIRINLEENQTIVDEVPYIQIEETINALKEQETYVFYIDEFGDLALNYVVKTNSVDYNDTITINGK